MSSLSDTPSHITKKSCDSTSIKEAEGRNSYQEPSAVLESDSEGETEEQEEEEEEEPELDDDNAMARKRFTKAAMTAGLNGFHNMMQSITNVFNAKKEAAEKMKEASIAAEAVKKQETERLIADEAVKKRETERLIAEEALKKREQELLLTKIEAAKLRIPLDPPAANALSFGLGQPMLIDSLVAVASPDISGTSTSVPISPGAPAV